MLRPSAAFFLGERQVALALNVEDAVGEITLRVHAIHVGRAEPQGVTVGVRKRRHEIGARKVERGEDLRRPAERETPAPAPPGLGLEAFAVEPRGADDGRGCNRVRPSTRAETLAPGQRKQRSRPGEKAPAARLDSHTPSFSRYTRNSRGTLPREASACATGVSRRFAVERLPEREVCVPFLGMRRFAQSWFDPGKPPWPSTDAAFSAV